MNWIQEWLQGRTAFSNQTVMVAAVVFALVLAAAIVG